MKSFTILLSFLLINSCSISNSDDSYKVANAIKKDAIILDKEVCHSPKKVQEAFNLVKQERLDELKEILIKCPKLASAKTINGNSLIHIASYKKKLDLVKLLVDEYQVSIDQVNNAKVSPIHLMATSGFMEGIKYFVEELGYSDLDLLDNMDQTPINKAVSFRSCHPKVVNYLYKNGADINKPDYEGWTPIASSILFRCYFGFSELIKLNADLNSKTIGGETPIIIALQAYFLGDKRYFNELIKNPNIDIHAINNEYKNIAIIAVMKKLYPLLVELMKLPMDLYVPDNKRRSAIMRLIVSGHYDAVKWLAKNYPQEIRPDSKDIVGNTALMYAVKRGLPFVAEELAKISNLNIKNNSGKMAIDLAKPGSTIFYILSQRM